MAWLNKCLCLASILSLICSSFSQTSPFTLHPTDTTYAVGELAILRCAVTSLGTSGILYWIKRESPTDTERYVSRGTTVYSSEFDDRRYSVSQVDYIFKLRISDLKLEDRGNYFCALYTGGVGEYSNVAFLEILRQWPRPTCTTDPQKAALEDSVKFICTLPTSASVPMPLTWSYKTMEFGGRKIVGPGESYSVQWTMKETDNYGYFSCYAGRSTGHGESCVDTPLKIPPTPEIRPATRTKFVGENADFNCEPIITFPNVTLYTWLTESQDGQYREYTASEDRFRIRQDGKNFKIKDLTKSENEMKIWCRAQNSLGINVEATMKAVLYVLPQSTESTINPRHSPHFRTGSDISNPAITGTTSFGVPSDNQKDNASVARGVIGGTIAGIILLIIVIVLTLYLVKDRDFSKFNLRPSGSIIPIIIERQRNANKRPSRINLHPISEKTRNPDPLDDGTVIYALPLQKGGGTIKVKKIESEQVSQAKPLEEVQSSESNIGYIRNSSATLPGGLRGPTAAKSEIRSSPSRTKLLSASALSLDSSLAKKSAYVLYSLPLQKGGGTMKVRSRNASMECLNKVKYEEQQPLFDTKVERDDNSYAELPLQDGEQEPAYADVNSKSLTDLSGKRFSGNERISEYENLRNSTDESASENVHKTSAQTNKSSGGEPGYADMNIGADMVNSKSLTDLSGKRFSGNERNSEYENFRNSKASAESNESLEGESGYADMNKGTDADKDESSYVNMGGNKKESESEYAEVEFGSCEVSFDSSFDNDLDDDSQQLNAEEVVYAHVDVDSKNSTDTQEDIIGNTDKTVYADIKDT